jgi:hypothetical protein
MKNSNFFLVPFGGGVPLFHVRIIIMDIWIFGYLIFEFFSASCKTDIRYRTYSLIQYKSLCHDKHGLA